MNDLINTNDQTMTLKEITDLLGVRHNDAMKTVEKMAENPEFGTIRKTRSVYNDKGQTIDTYILNKRQSMAASAKLNTAMLMKVIDRWMELESKLTPKDLSRVDILQMAIESEKEKLALKHEVEELKPKAEFHDKVAVAPDAISIGKAAKLLGTGRNRLLSYLRKIGWVTRKNEPYQTKIESGLMDVKLGDFKHPDHGLQQ